MSSCQTLVWDLCLQGSPEAADIDREPSYIGRCILVRTLGIQDHLAPETTLAQETSSRDRLAPETVYLWGRAPGTKSLGEHQSSRDQYSSRDHLAKKTSSRDHLVQETSSRDQQHQNITPQHHIITPHPQKTKPNSATKPQARPRPKSSKFRLRRRPPTTTVHHTPKSKAPEPTNYTDQQPFKTIQLQRPFSTRYHSASETL